ncbi:glycosyltransferase [Parapedobacter sp. ISTM3]|uniref:Glycosyl transferase family 2 n=1 Tax=Parapedobacter luteus TaxID=623280 RepID=A0A1T5BNS0_9SPHI|nr:MULTISPECIES: glycosyltransferase [Parapedobacter]MBK1439383.1 glycosyltransferase [Parapedobacter sp. ISTM3]SKB48739.1 Glycosyl transferase family 2 [Parapedobacter luteus]
MQNNRYPEITVLMPVFNAERYIGSAVASILNQTFMDFELLIVDDGSTDATMETLSRFDDSRIRIIKNEGNRGIVYSLNKGISLAQGKFIARMDADDISEPSRLMLQHRYLTNHPHVDLCGSGMILFDDEGIIGKVYYNLDWDTLKAETLFNSPFPHPGVMVRREVLLANPYRAEALHAEDYDLWSRLLRTHRGVNLPGFLLHYRISSDDITAKASKRIDERKRIISRIHQDNFAYLGYTPTVDALNIHYQLSSTEGIKRMELGDIKMEVLRDHFHELLNSVRNTGYCRAASFYSVCGKIYLKLLLYRGKDMGVWNFIVLLSSFQLWIGIGAAALLRASYFLRKVHQLTARG